MHGFKANDAFFKLQKRCFCLIMTTYLRIVLYRFFFWLVHLWLSIKCNAQVATLVKTGF